MWVNEPNKSTRTRQINKITNKEKIKTKSSGQRQVHAKTMPPSPKPDGLAVSLCATQLRTRWMMCSIAGSIPGQLTCRTQSVCESKADADRPRLTKSARLQLFLEEDFSSTGAALHPKQVQ